MGARKKDWTGKGAKKPNPCFSLSQGCFSLIGTAGTGVLIAMTVYLYKDSCKELSSSMYESVSPFIITQYVTFACFAVCSACTMVFVQCCAIFAVAALDSKFERV